MCVLKILFLLVYMLHMIPLFTEDQYFESEHFHKLSLKCPQCKQIIYRLKSSIRDSRRKKRMMFCTKKCKSLYFGSCFQYECTYCLKLFTRVFSAKIGKNRFCSSSCATTYNNTHKTIGYRRSKLEIYLEKELIAHYPNLEFHFNRKDTINSELDIYIPSLKLAFELNGIFHYEPIYGEEKLKSIQNNDTRKFQACLEKEIELVIIDSSQLKYFKKSNAKPFLTIIVNLINQKLEL